VSLLAASAFECSNPATNLSKELAGNAMGALVDCLSFAQRARRAHGEDHAQQVVAELNCSLAGETVVVIKVVLEIPTPRG
jgi:hypothetical protein